MPFGLTVVPAKAGTCLPGGCATGKIKMDSVLRRNDGLERFS
jgi:hypothetical protein